MKIVIIVRAKSLEDLEHEMNKPVDYMPYGNLNYINNEYIIVMMKTAMLCSC